MGPEDLVGLAPFINFGGWIAVGSLVIVSVARGWLVPARLMNEMRSLYQERLNDKTQQLADWKEMARTSDSRADLQAAAMADMTATMKTILEAVAHREGTPR